MKKYLALCFCLMSSCTRDSTHTDLGLVSFYRGYISWKDNTENRHLPPCDVDPFVQGVRAASEGKTLPLDEEEMKQKVADFYDSFATAQRAKYLAEAETYLQNLPDGCVELEPGKLYYRCIQPGTGSILLSATGAASMIYQTKVLEDGALREVFSTEISPVPVHLSDTLPAFAKGVEGMKEGEVRVIYIHPKLAVLGGSNPNLLKLNQLIVIEVKLEQIQNLKKQ